MHQKIKSGCLKASVEIADRSCLRICSGEEGNWPLNKCTLCAR